jgi:hypothetical protein
VGERWGSFGVQSKVCCALISGVRPQRQLLRAMIGCGKRENNAIGTLSNRVDGDLLIWKMQLFQLP